MSLLALSDSAAAKHLRDGWLTLAAQCQNDIDRMLPSASTPENLRVIESLRGVRDRSLDRAKAYE